MRILGLVVASLLSTGACRSAPAPRPPPAASATVAGEYTSGGDCAHGTPENPTCLSWLTLDGDGTGSFVGDDIIEPLTWKQTGDVVLVAIGTRSLELHVKDGILVDTYGVRWTRT